MTPAPHKPVHPKVKAAARIAALLLVIDGVIVAAEQAVPSPSVIAVLAVLHSVLPVVAGYLTSA